jgi:hypothetical protein
LKGSENIGDFKMVENNASAPRLLLYGARAVARRMGDESLAPVIRRHPEGLPLFLLGNVICGYADAIDAALAAKEAAGLTGLRPVTRKRPSPRLELADA